MSLIIAAYSTSALFGSNSALSPYGEGSLSSFGCKFEALSMGSLPFRKRHVRILEDEICGKVHPKCKKCCLCGLSNRRKSGSTYSCRHQLRGCVHKTLARSYYGACSSMPCLQERAGAFIQSSYLSDSDPSQVTRETPDQPMIVT